MKRLLTVLWCGWIMWGLTSAGDWSPAMGFPTYEACTARVNSTARGQKGILSWECFPSDFDPRERAK